MTSTIVPNGSEIAVIFSPLPIRARAYRTDTKYRRLAGDPRTETPAFIRNAEDHLRNAWDVSQPAREPGSRLT